MSPEEQAKAEAAVRAQIREGMTVLGPDGELGRVFAVGDQALALERGFVTPHEWKVPYREVERVDERGVWLRRGSAALEPVSDAFTGPAGPYRAAAEASPIHQWTGFDPPAVVPRRPEGQAPPTGEERHASDAPSHSGDDPPTRH